MANILDGLLGRISDTDLRAAIVEEIVRLRESKSFGLVFERHLPESVRLYHQRITRGSKVQVKQEEAGKTWIVAQVSNETAMLVDSNGTTSSQPVENLVTVAEFGDPIYPGLRTIASVKDGEGKPPHIVINGENYHALETLHYAFAGQVDCIYIDPPYNSGARDWTYNNDFVDKNDSYRHSKWLSFIEKRLRLARYLLKDDSVLVITVDEHEVNRLGVLLGQLFPDADITMVTIVINPKGVTRPGVRRFSRVEEYAFFCFFGNAEIEPIGDDLLSRSADLLEADISQEDGPTRPRWKGLLRSGSDARRQDREEMFYPVLIDPDRGAVLDVGEPLPLDQQPDFDTTINGLTPVWPVRSNLTLGRWGVGPATLKRLIESGYVKLGGYDQRRNTWAITYLSAELQRQIETGQLVIDSYDEERNVVDAIYASPESASRRIKTVWHRTSHDAGAGGTDVITGLLGTRAFTYPKSVFAVRDTLAMLTKSKKDALILDFFGGSGTTTHATMMLNAEDGGTRRSLLVTNNEVDSDEQTGLIAAGYDPSTPEWRERGVFFRATKPRIEAAVTGRRPGGQPIDTKFKNANGTPMCNGFSENVEFLELTYLDRNEVSRGKAFEAVAPLLWLKAGAKGCMIERITGPYAAPPEAYYAILFDVTAWRAFLDAVRDRPDLEHIFVVTDSLAQYQQVAAELPQGVDASMLYEDYIRNFEITLGGLP